MRWPGPATWNVKREVSPDRLRRWPRREEHLSDLIHPPDIADFALDPPPQLGHLKVMREATYPYKKDNAVALQTLGGQRFLKIHKLTVRDDQQRFVEHPARFVNNLFQDFALMVSTITFDGEVVGMVAYAMQSDWNGVIYQVMIDQAHQGNGYGAAGVKLTIAELVSNGAETVELACQKGNPAVSVFERIGFVETGETRDDKLTMRWTLPDNVPRPDARDV